MAAAEPRFGRNGAKRAHQWQQGGHVITTPHVASGTHETRQAMGDLMIDNLDAFFRRQGDADARGVAGRASAAGEL